MKLNKLFTLFISCIPMITFASLPKESPVPGGVIRLPLGIKSESEPKVKFDNKDVISIRDDNGEWIAIVGIPLSFKDKQGKITLESPEKKEISFNVKKSHYKTEKLTIKNKRLVTPSEKDLKKIQEDRVLVQKARERFTNRSPNLNLLQPTKGRMSSSFGLRRIMNGVEKNPHNGMDIAAPTGTIVNASEEGEVVLATSLFYSGNTVIIDHGHGLLTIYCHLDSINTKNGDIVKRGQNIGTVGMTGRVTGPHLHWSVEINGAKVDPSLFLNLEREV